MGAAGRRRTAGHMVACCYVTHYAALVKHRSRAWPGRGGAVDGGTRLRQRITIDQTLDAVPAPYDQTYYDAKCAAVYEHIYASYAGQGRSIYAA